MMCSNEPAVSRRAFCRTVGASAALASATGSIVPRSWAAPPDKQFPPGHYFDIHTHIGKTWNRTEPVSVEHLLRWMDENQISQAAVLPVVSPEASSFPMTTDAVLAQTKPYRDRLIPFCVLDPRTTLFGGLKALPEVLHRWVEQGVKGFGEHKPGVKIDDPRNLAIYAACGDLKLPVLFHLDNERNMDRPGLPGLESVLRQLPHTTFIGHGPGWWASISASASQADLNGYPTGPITPGGAIDHLMDQYPNIFGDLSAGSGAGALSRDMKFAREFLIRRADRLMFGTDYLAPGQKVEQLTLLRLIDLPGPIQAKIFRDNARHLLGLT